MGFNSGFKGLKLDLSHDKDKITWEFGEHVIEEKIWTSEERWGKSESVTWLIDGVDAEESYLSHHIVVYRLVTPVQLQLFRKAIGSLVHAQKGTELRILPVQFIDMFRFIKQNRPLYRNAWHTRTNKRHCTYKQVLACIE